MKITTFHIILQEKSSQSLEERLFGLEKNKTIIVLFFYAFSSRKCVEICQFPVAPFGKTKES
jgi:hypothetical protein